MLIKELLLLVEDQIKFEYPEDMIYWQYDTKSDAIKASPERLPSGQIKITLPKLKKLTDAEYLANVNTVRSGKSLNSAYGKKGNGSNPVDSKIEKLLKKLKFEATVDERSDKIKIIFHDLPSEEDMDKIEKALMKLQYTDFSWKRDTLIILLD